MTQRMQRALLAAVIGVCLAFTLPGFADSLVRIVRLSDVEGNVQIDRHTGQGFERAILNMPVAQGISVRTGEDGRAEAEFEDGTAIRLVPGTQVDFRQLMLRSSGAKVSTVELQEGTAYFNVNHQKDDEFTVRLGEREIPIAHSARFRLGLSDTAVKLAVFKGEVTVKQNGDELKVKKGEELSFDLVQNGNALAKNIEPGQYDQWDQQRIDYHQRYYSGSSYNSYPFYGRGDLSYYGGWYNLPGYGSLWQPYSAGFGWSPFDTGYWCWYPGIGYTWVSGYPWGWLPYRYGSWVWVPGWGWGWNPGRYWGSWTPIPTVVNAPTPRYRPAPPAIPNRPTTSAGFRPHQPFDPGLPRDPRLNERESRVSPPVVTTVFPHSARPPVVRATPGMTVTQPIAPGMTARPSAAVNRSSPGTPASPTPSPSRSGTGSSGHWSGASSSGAGHSGSSGAGHSGAGAGHSGGSSHGSSSGSGRTSH